MKSKAFAVLAAATSVALAKSASAALFFVVFSPVGTVPAAPASVPAGNPTLSLNVGQSYSAYIMCQVPQNGTFTDPDSGDTSPTFEHVNGYGLDVMTTGTALTSTAAQNTIYNTTPVTWNTPINPGTGSSATSLTTNQNAVAVTAMGLDGANTTQASRYNAAGHIYRVQRIDFTANQAGVTNLFLQANAGTVSYAVGGAPVDGTTHFGNGDAGVNAAVPLTRSSLADAVITTTAVVSSHFTLTAGGTPADVTVNGNAGGYNVATYVIPVGETTVGSTVIGFNPTNPGFALVALDFSGTAAAIAAVIAKYGLSATVNPVFGAGYDAQISIPLSGGSATLDYDLTGDGVTLTNIAAVPEPTGLAVLGLLGLPALRRRRA